MQEYPEITVVLADIRSAHNVGAIFRTAEAAGVREILLAGYTPAPIDRFGRERSDIKKASLGAEKCVPWQHFGSHESCIEYIQEKNLALVAVEQTPTAVPYDSHTLKGPTALVFGNETRGVPEEFLKSADASIEIPMSGKKESLNVSVTAGIILFHFRDR